MTNAEVRAYLLAVDAAAVRVRAGITLGTIAVALGVSRSHVWKWENRAHFPNGTRGAAYCRIIAGLARHLEIREGG